ncbi:MAG: PAS domain S-box protein [Deltaproteobacteria bacterium]|nr:PAS domain S-box protein [Deltaproteobacteria bacterium]
MIIIEDPISTCRECPLAKVYSNHRVMTIRLEHHQKVYGFISVSIPTRLASDQKEQSLFKEVAGDIAFALHDIELDEERKALQDSEERYRTIFENTGTATLIIEEDTIISMVNTQFEKLSGYSKEEIENKMKWTEFVLPEDLERKG